ncbi:hypothetical protein BN128_4291 [Cronobacter sakazakii 696]|nr:hypothetical protein BN128_4291 [Cronobacter sakazakii 696]
MPPSCNAKYSEKGIITGAVVHPPPQNAFTHSHLSCIAAALH